MMAIQFDMEAVATEKLNIFWLNKKLGELGKDPKPDLTDSLKDGVAMIQVLEHISPAGKRPKKYAKMARMDIQKQDNWSCLVDFMRSLGKSGERGGGGRTPSLSEYNTIHLQCPALTSFSSSTTV